MDKLITDIKLDILAIIQIYGDDIAPKASMTVNQIRKIKEKQSIHHLTIDKCERIIEAADRLKVSK